ncbi:hypothetical protein LP419_02395 [Massilia sp. H-1]|nr:hypothetical protein LP419_02395 [Massilia sp. H-1]
MCIDILLDAPWPLLLVWGERKVVVYNAAYAALAGPDHPDAPGARVLGRDAYPPAGSLAA